MNIVQDLLITNKRVLKKTVPSLINNPVLLVVGIPYGVVFILGIKLAAMAGFLGGIIGIVINSAIISDYLSLIEKIRYGHHVTINDIRMGYKTYLLPVWSLLFLLYFINLALNMFLFPLNIMTGGLLFLMVKTLIYTLLSAIPETIYQKHYDQGEMVIYSFNFVKENVIQWLLPNLILIGVTYGVYKGMLHVLSLIFGFGTIGIAISVLVSIIIIQGLFGFIMIYRAFLFEILSGSTLRKRLFMRHMYKD